MQKAKILTKKISFLLNIALNIDFLVQVYGNFYVFIKTYEKGSKTSILIQKSTYLLQKRMIFE
jgi:hypothetical protein